MVVRVVVSGEMGCIEEPNEWSDGGCIEVTNLLGTDDSVRW